MKSLLIILSLGLFASCSTTQRGPHESKGKRQLASIIFETPSITKIKITSSKQSSNSKFIYGYDNKSKKRISAYKGGSDYSYQIFGSQGSESKWFYVSQKEINSLRNLIKNATANCPVTLHIEKSEPIITRVVSPCSQYAELETDNSYESGSDQI